MHVHILRCCNVSCFIKMQRIWLCDVCFYIFFINSIPYIFILFRSTNVSRMGVNPGGDGGDMSPPIRGLSPPPPKKKYI